ncbi:carbohydrate kinase family protein [Nostoc sp. CHAB 5715]|nr:carbohydrate kinase family protein [Nostoc sp. CHAB 5836]MCC5621614.1 carbohydrate kinase family protein [Nostoc sp. CHAB 5715]
MSTKTIVALGGAHIDRRGRIAGTTVAGASNPGSWMEEAGGGAFNVARSLARLGHRVTMIAPRGGDAAGEIVADAAEASGVIDKPLVFLDRRTPSYTAILEADGNLVIALADMDLYRLFSPRRLTTRQVRAELDAADLVVCDANLPAETLTALARDCAARGLPLVAIAISPAKVVRLREALPHLSALFMNIAEARALLDDTVPTVNIAENLLALGLAGGVVTAGKASLTGWNRQSRLEIQPPEIAVIGDVTGAGDAMAAGVIHAMLGHLGLEDQLASGVAAAGLAVRTTSATIENLDTAMLNAAIGLAGPLKILSRTDKTH